MAVDGIINNEPVSQDQILRGEQVQGNLDFPCSANHKQNWLPYTVDPYSAMYVWSALLAGTTLTTGPLPADSRQ